MFNNKNSLMVLSMLGLVAANDAFSFETKARNVILEDAQTGEYLYVKDHEKMIPTASMSKLMTVYMLFDALKKGRISLESVFTTSEKAWKEGGAATGGSTMFLKIGDEVKVEDLLRGIIVQSGNDACIVAAENMSGTEEEFVAKMNEKAQELGLKNSHFENSTGLPHPDHKMSVEDLAKLSNLIINEFPEFYHIFAQKEFTYNGIKQWNRNPLLYSTNGADGLKTGHTEEAGFGLAASAKRGDRRLIAVMAGLKSNKERSEEAESLMNWGFGEFDNYTLIKSDKVLEQIPVWYGSKEFVSAGLEKDMIKTMERTKSKTAKISVEYDTPIRAPIVENQKIGVVKVEYDGKTSEYPLVAKEEVKEANYLGKFVANIKYLLFGGK